MVRDAGSLSCERSLPPTSRPSSAKVFSTTTICCSTGPQLMAEPELGAEIGQRFRTYWSTSIRTPTACRLRSFSHLSQMDGV